MSDDATTPGIASFLELFRVQAGISHERAFEEVSLLLGCIRDLSKLEEQHPAAITALFYLSSLAKALMNDLEISRNSLH